MDLPKLNDLNITGKKVLVRADFNVENADNPRVNSIREIVQLLKEKKALKIKIIGHNETDFDLVGALKNEFQEVEFDSSLRDNPGEKENDQSFATELADGWEVYINEAFSVSHRVHASIVSLPKIIKKNGGNICIGPRFEKELENLNKVLKNPKKPVVAIISGVKKDKLDYVEKFKKLADKILVGGRLPDYEEEHVESVRLQRNEKTIVANLMPDKEDITLNSAETFEKVIKDAGTVVLSGPLGKFEEEGHRLGTKRVFGAIANSDAFKVAGGGDTEAAISLFNLETKFDWISVGGGAMLEYLTTGSLPAIEALLN